MLNTEVIFISENPVTTPSSAKQQQKNSSIRTHVWLQCKPLNLLPKAARRGSGCSSNAELPEVLGLGRGPRPRLLPAAPVLSAGAGTAITAKRMRWCRAEPPRGGSGCPCGSVRVTATSSSRGTRPLPPADGFVDADGHEDDGEQQGAEDAAQQHCEGGGRQIKSLPHGTKRSRPLPPPRSLPRFCFCSTA